MKAKIIRDAADVEYEMKIHYRMHRHYQTLEDVLNWYRAPNFMLPKKLNGAHHSPQGMIALGRSKEVWDLVLLTIGV